MQSARRPLINRLPIEVQMQIKWSSTADFAMYHFNKTGLYCFLNSDSKGLCREVKKNGHAD